VHSRRHQPAFWVVTAYGSPLVTFSTGRWRCSRTSADVDVLPLLFKEESGGSLRDFSEFDEWQVPAPRQVLHLQLEPLATATAHRGLRPGAR
jgi:hypothetical protein